MVIEETVSIEIAFNEKTALHRKLFRTYLSYFLISDFQHGIVDAILIIFYYQQQNRL